ncbi:LLM class flavin-dependent oxidoreductase [Actinomadura livida]|uniref:Alkanesulfonate monooxygenase n=1 Tax=Actinomadura livida TaxID=79909 RepID=A0A7W7N227_9ACTN|nr:MULTISPECIES: LLM class flavin-dependent oxidoreductase [Actinomadura]MBB4778565.1 alkanesulfonate monooxygenase [Actinomadura catellatispora]GGU38262.1 alkanesulfonate monooxygenase [Actinomadura livida]
MTLRFHWFLPTTGDGRSLVGGGHSVPKGVALPAEDAGTADRFREPGIDYLAQVARTAEQLGFEAVLTPTGTWCEDAWLVTAALLRETRRLKFLVAFRPGLLSPTLAAQMAATYQRLSGGRLALNVVTGGEAVEQRRFGDHLDHDERYARTDEFLSVVRGVWGGEPFDFTGEHYRVEGATVRQAPDPVPRIYFGGSSGAAGPVAARHADVYLTWGEPPGQVAAKIAHVRELAGREGRGVRFGIRLHTLSRDTSEQAWAEAARLLDGLDPAAVAQAQQALAASESVGQQRMRTLHQRYRDGQGTGVRDLEIHPNLWAGVGLVRGGAGTALVGSHTEVADRIEEYAALGIEEFILSGYPHIEEAYWFGEGVLPELRRRGQVPHLRATG